MAEENPLVLELNEQKLSMVPRDRILMPGPALLEGSPTVNSQFSQTLICFRRNSVKHGNALPNFSGPGLSSPSLSQRNVFQQLKITQNLSNSLLKRDTGILLLSSPEPDRRSIRNGQCSQSDSYPRSSLRGPCVALSFLRIFSSPAATLNVKPQTLNYLKIGCRNSLYKGVSYF